MVSHVFHISIDMDHLLAEKIRCSRFAGTHMYLRIQHMRKLKKKPSIRFSIAGCLFVPGIVHSP